MCGYSYISIEILLLCRKKNLMNHRIHIIDALEDFFKFYYLTINYLTITRFYYLTINQITRLSSNIFKTIYKIQ